MSNQQFRNPRPKVIHMDSHCPTPSVIMASKTIMKTETVIFDTIVPHPAPVNIAELLAEIEGVIKRHVVLSEPAAAALAVWVLHSYTFELRDTVAYVAIESPEKRCGKTTLLSVLAAMASKSIIASNITVGALFRAIHTCTPTLFIDEADTFLAGNSIMRGIINSGNTRRTAYVLRLAASKRRDAVQRRLADSVPGGSAPPEQGDVTITGSLPRAATNTLAPPDFPAEGTDNGLKKYSCWCPKVIAMIGEVPDTIADRSIVVKMARKLTTETCAPLSELNTSEIKAKCARFARDMAQFIAEAGKIRGEGLNDRAADTFDPLFVIARLAGEEWEEKLREAALALSSTADIENSGSGLILDIMDIIGESGREKMFSRDIVASLREGGLKSQTLKNPSLNEHQMARILRPYGVKPIAMRIGKEVRSRYLGEDFRDALKRYVSKENIEARIQAIKQRRKLQKEAEAEAAKLEAAFQKFKAALPKDKKLSEGEMKELALKITREEEEREMAGSP
jgi:putative DNA primase/helicase